jgi:excinuclease ABC subunit A
VVSAVRAEVNDMVSRFDDIKVMLDDHDGCTQVNHFVDDIEELADIVGEIVCTGTPEEIAMCDASYTGQYLKKILFRNK